MLYFHPKKEPLSMKVFLSVFFVLSLFVFSGCNNDGGTNSNLATILGINPNIVSKGQTSIQGIITGTNFTGVTSVTLGDAIAVEEFSATSATEIQVRFSVSRSAASGVRTIVVVTPAGSASSSGSLLSVDNNAAPLASFSIDPPAGSTATTFTLDGSSSRDSDGTVTQYSWNLGDGHTDNGKVITHKFTSIATFNITLTVKDNDGATQTLSKDVEVLSNSPPVAVIDAPANGFVKNRVHFDGTGSFDSDGRVTDYLWDFGDNSAKSHQPELDHEFAKENTFTVTLRVTDNKGQTGLGTSDIKIEKAREIQCAGGTQRGPDIFIDVLSFSSPFAIFKLDGGGGSCGRIFYKCGDLRKGGLHPGQAEEWWGTICAMWDRLDGTFRVQLVRGNAAPHPETRDLYFHAQDCRGGYCR